MDGGSYGVVSRGALAVGVWWALILVVGLGLGPRAGLRPPALAAGAALAGLALLAGASAAWGASAEAALLELDRTALYLGVGALVVVSSRPGSVPCSADGLAFGIVTVAAIALATRLFPDYAPAGVSDVPSLLPGADRLAYPLNYWNGLGVLLALALPLLWRAAVAERALAAGAAVAAVPLLAATLYLTSSRGAAIAASLGTIAFLAITGNRWRALVAMSLGAAGAALAIGVLGARPSLTDGPFDSPAAVEAGRDAALLVLFACTAAGLGYGLLVRFARVPPPRAAVGWALVALLVLVGAGAAFAADPFERFRDFQRVPAEVEQPDQGFVPSHLLSTTGSGRWQFWEAAVDAWRGDPVLGRGAGSYEAWWARTGSIAHFIRDAHSLYLEVLAELGLVGLALLLVVLGAGAAAAIAQKRASTRERTTVAALAATLLAYAAAAGVDWMWEMTLVSVVAFACLGLLMGSTGEPPRADVFPRRRSRRAAVITGAALGVAWLALCAQAVPLLTQLELAASEESVRRGDGASAQHHAEAARAIQPWAASPYLQLALVEEQGGRLDQARRRIAQALERDAEDWRLWLVSARIETKAGRIGAAQASLERAVELNPRSPLFSSNR
jgi:O-antigen ligase